MKRAWLALFAVAIMLIASTSLGSTDHASAAPSTIKVKAGGGEAGYAVNAFLPGTVTVETGSTISFQFTWFEPHTVALASRAVAGALGQPTVGPATSPVTYDGSALTLTTAIYTDLIFGKPDGTVPSFDVTFTKAGSYDYICTIHPFMDAKVIVVDSGTTDTQATADTRATSEYTTAATALKGLAAGLKAKPVAVAPKTGGGNAYTLAIGGSTLSGDVQLFIPDSQPVKVGDTIHWVTSTPTPHTVTFGPLNPPPGPGFDPFAVPPSAPAAGYDGTGFVNSGILSASPPGAPVDPGAVTTFDLTFTKAGTYAYYCILHQNQGMAGTVVVTAQQAGTPTATASPSATTAPTTPTVAPSTPTPLPPAPTATPVPPTPVPPTPTAVPPTATREAPAPPNTGTGPADDGGNSSWLMLAGVAAATALAGTTFVVGRRRR